MAGAVQLNPDDPLRNRQIAYKDKNGQWRAGPDAPGYQKGQFIPTTTESYEYEREGELVSVTRTKPAGNVGRSFHNRQRANYVRKIMRKEDMSESEAREFINERIDELEQAQREGRPKDEIDEIRRQLMGSP